VTSIVQPCLIASSPRNRSTELMPTAESSSARLQALSHGRKQTRPMTAGSGLSAMICRHAAS